MKEFEIRPYPFESGENPILIQQQTETSMQNLLTDELFADLNSQELMSSFKTYYAFANMFFNEEEALRNSEVEGANLFYHNRSHAVQQVTFDAITLVKGILKRKDAFSKHLTANGTLSIILGSMFHDSGYVSAGPVENYASRTPIHVDESIANFESMVNLLGLPEGLDIQKVRLLGKIAIHGTHFPFTAVRMDESETLMGTLTAEESKEAHIVRLTTQLADLGGQCARPDYFPQLIKNLRDELNGATPELGTKIVGDDAVLAPNCEFFLNTFVRKQHSPTKNVETTALAFFGEENSRPLRNAWFKNGS
jgi:hypothetical protein